MFRGKRLFLHEAAENADIVFHQLRIRSRLGDFSLVQHANRVGVTNGAEPGNRGQGTDVIAVVRLTGCALSNNVLEFMWFI